MICTAPWHEPCAASTEAIAFGVAGLALAFRTVGRLERGARIEAAPALDAPTAEEAVQAAPSSGMPL